MSRRLPLLGVFFVLSSLTLAAWTTPLALAQGVLIVVNNGEPIWLPRPHPHPHPPRPFPPPSPPPVSYKIKELAVNARIVDQVGQVQVSQSFVNTGSRQMEVSFVFPLPYDGAVEQLTFLVDGKEYEAKLLDAKQAREIYEGYIRRNQDPALLEWIGTGMFKTSVFPVPPGAERTVTLRYSQLLRKDHALTDFLFPLSTAKYTSAALEKLSIRATIESKERLKSVYSPTHAVDVQRSDDHHAVVKYESQHSIPSSDFRLMYDTAHSELGASVISYRPEGEKNGYFLLLASPEVKREDRELPKKTVVFVVDRSGSMSGKKIEQAREALKSVLDNLRKGDLFNIVAYDSTVESFRPELQRYDDDSRRAALGFIEGIYAGGSTNIDGALSTALEMVQDPDRPTYLVFLTDGRPTAGETNESKIVQRARESNKHRARVIGLGVGYDVNSRLLDRITNENHGRTEFVRPDEDLEEHVARLYARISAPVMTDVEVTIDIEGTREESGKPVNRVYPREVPDLFAGEQLVLVGRYTQSGAGKVVIRGKVGSETRKVDFPAQFVEESRDETYAFVEKLWAMRRVGEILVEIDLNGKNDELVDELVQLSTRHGIITPYTSFLADDQDQGRPLASTEAVRRAREQLSRLDVTDGRSGVAQRGFRGELQQADRVADVFQAGRPAGFGGAGGLPAAPAGGPAASDAAAKTPTPGAVVLRDASTDELVELEGVRQVANETLYRRGQVWIAGNAKDVDLERDAAKIETVKRFSDEYFKLVSANTHAENAVLASQQVGEELLIKLRGVVYRIQ